MPGCRLRQGSPGQSCKKPAGHRGLCVLQARPPGAAPAGSLAGEVSAVRTSRRVSGISRTLGRDNDLTTPAQGAQKKPAAGAGKKGMRWQTGSGGLFPVFC